MRLSASWIMARISLPIVLSSADVSERVIFSDADLSWSRAGLDQGVSQFFGELHLDWCASITHQLSYSWQAANGRPAPFRMSNGSSWEELKILIHSSRIGNNGSI